MSSVMVTDLKLFGAQWMAEIEGATGAGIREATKMLHKECRRVVSVRVFPRSLPGEPPRLETGVGRKSIEWEFDAATSTGRVGINTSIARHMIYLELGTARIRPRPWLVKTFLALLGRIDKIAFATRRVA